MIDIKKDEELLCRARVADSFFSRLRGLMFTKELSTDEGLLIKYSVRSSSRTVHGFFMRYPTDLIFIDKDKRVCEIGYLPRWWYCIPSEECVWVLEVNKGFAKRKGLNVGDALNFET